MEKDRAANQQQQKGSKAVKMTTSIRLLDPAALAKASAVPQKHKSDGSGGRQEPSADGSLQPPRAPVEVPAALRSFPPLVAACMTSLDFSEPTPIQAAAWPAACGCRDVMAVAEPGSGKTLGYLVPALLRISEQLQKGGAAAAGGGQEEEEEGVGEGGGVVARPLALVLAPTRELALQVSLQAKALRGATRITSAVVYGGVLRGQQVRKLCGREGVMVDVGLCACVRLHCVSLLGGELTVCVHRHSSARTQPEPPRPASPHNPHQIDALSRHPQLLVATPGRLLDLIDAGHISLDKVACVVLDEADKMLNLGFAPQLDRLREMVLSGRAAAAAAAGGSAGGQEGKRQGKKKKGGKGGADERGGGAGGASGRPQVLLFTATMPEEVEVTAGAWLAAGAERVRSAPSAASISTTITQVGLRFGVFVHGWCVAMCCGCGGVADPPTRRHTILSHTRPSDNPNHLPKPPLPPHLPQNKNRLSTSARSTKSPPSS
jgi:hypothetical protein